MKSAMDILRGSCFAEIDISVNVAIFTTIGKRIESLQGHITFIQFFFYIILEIYKTWNNLQISQTKTLAVNLENSCIRIAQIKRIF